MAIDKAKAAKALFYLVMFIAALANVFGIDVPITPAI